jgi:Helicase conserved C-terminal domain/Type III restriction enzyme, res subunit
MLNLNIGDRLHFFNSGKVEAFRYGRSLGIFRCSLPLSKRAAPTEQKHDPKLPPNTHWITVHGEHEGGGSHVLVRDNPDGSASVVGGAGGKINHLRLKLRSPKEWKASAKVRSAEKQNKGKKRKEALTPEERQDEFESKRAAKQAYQDNRKENALATIAALEEHGVSHGLTPEQQNALKSAPAPDATPEEIRQHQQTEQDALKQIRQIHQSFEHRLVTDHEARSAALLGDGAIGDADKKLVEGQGHTAGMGEGEAIATLQKLPDGKWLAASNNLDETPQTFDSWHDAAKAHVRNVLAAEQELSAGTRTQPDEFYDPAQWADNAGGAFSPAAAAKIAALSSARKQINRDEKQSKKEIEKGNPFTAPAYDIAGSEAKALESLEVEAKTLEDAFTNNNFLNLVDQGDARKLRPAIANGGYAQLAEIASEVLKQNPVSRALVDAIGHNEAAKVVAHQIRQALSPEEYDRVTKAQAAFHAKVSTRLAKATTEKVKPMMLQLQQHHQRVLELEAESGGNYSPAQQIELDNLTYESGQLNESIQRTVGEVAGKLQASAAMVQALESKPRSLHIADTEGKILDKLSPILSSEQDAPGLFQQFGLTADDYAIGEDAIQVNESGMKKLAVGYDPEDRQAYDEALAIKRGEQDENDYLPAGFVYRPRASFAAPGGESNRFDADLNLRDGMPPDEMESALKSYIGGRVANGDNPLDVMTDVRSPELYLSQGLDPYGELALGVQESANKLVQRVAGGDRISDKAVRDAFQELGDSEAATQRKARQTDDLEALHSQKLDGVIATEAAHRALAEMPMARVALKDFGQVTGREKRWLRDYAITNVLGKELEKRETKKPAADAEPEQEMQADLFGGFTSAAEVAQSQKGESEVELTQWQEFSKLMGGDKAAYNAVLDQLKGQYLNRFANSYGAIAGKPVLVGGQNIQHVDRLLLAKLPDDERLEMLEFMRSRDQSEKAKSRSRSGGKFAAEVDDAWLEKYENLKGDNRQISLLQADTGRTTPKTDYQRVTVGDAAEQQLLGMMRDRIIPNFEQVNDAIDLIPEVSWGAGTHITKQRASKFIQVRKKVGIWFGAGSGKSSVALGTFSDLHDKGEAKRMIVAVPSAILGQFVGEGVNFLKPGTYNYSANIGWDKEERLKALADPNLHIHITTRESLANDLLSIVEKHSGVTAEQFMEKGEDDRRQLMGDAMKAEGIDPSSLMLGVDEAHDISQRKGVDASKRSLAIEAAAHHSSHYVEFTGTPLKNDPSEVYSFLHRVDPEKFNDRAAFLREYGSEGARRSLQRVIAPYVYSSSTKPRAKDGRTLQMKEEQPKVAISEYQSKERQRILNDYRVVADYYAAKRREHGADISREHLADAWDNVPVREAIDRLSSEDTYKNLPEDQKKEQIAGQVMGGAGIKEKALNRLYHRSPYEHNPKMQQTVKIAKEMVGQGKAGVVFSASSQAAAQLKEQMAKQGIRVGLIDGSMSAEQKTAERLKFSPAEGQKAEYDVLVCTDACQTGLNLQRGKFLVHFDIPQTQKAYDQRSARIHRFRQTEDTTVITPQLDVPEEAIAWARMGRKGRSGAVFQAKAELLDDTGLAGEIRRSA